MGSSIPYDEKKELNFNIIAEDKINKIDKIEIITSNYKVIKSIKDMQQERIRYIFKFPANKAEKYYVAKIYMQDKTLTQFISRGVSYGLRFLGKDIFSPFESSTTYNKHYELEGNNREKIIINGAIGKVVVENSKSSNIIIDAVVNVKNGHKDFLEGNEENIINIDDNKVLSINPSKVFSKNNMKFISVDYIIKVPDNIPLEIDNKFGVTTIKGTSGDIKIESSAGKVDVQKVKGNVFVDNEFGATECTDIDGNIKIENTNGAMTVGNVSGKAELKGEFGAIKANNIKGDTIIKNTNGSVKYTSKEAVTSNVNIESNFGKITLILPKAQNGVFNCETNFGNIKTDFNLQVNKNDNNSTLKGNIGDGKANITVINNNGNIDILH